MVSTAVGDDRAVLEGSHRLLECHSFDELTQATMQTLQELLRGASSCFGIAYEDDDERRLHRICARGQVTADDLQVYQTTYWRSDPVLTDMLSRQWEGLNRIVVLERLVDMDRFTATDLYNCFLSPIGAHHVLGLAVSLGDDARALLGVHLPRTSPHGFGARHVAVAKALVPAIAASYTRVLLREDLLDRESVIDALADGEPHDGLVLLDRHLRLLFADAPAREHLRRLHSAEGEWDIDRRALPCHLRDCLGRVIDATDLAASVATIDAADFDGTGRAPGVRLRSLRNSRTAARYLLAFRPQRSLGSGDASLGQLTVREYEIAHHVARGCTNPEIASALRLSVRTIENHLRSIYSKLQVRNRAALARAFGAIIAH